ncbi:MAG: CHASE3 domain-containing protein [Gallionellaceae bacterium]|nr:CHASE3 domain-containing protein [Gallionellaceae bacterium]
MRQGTGWQILLRSLVGVMAVLAVPGSLIWYDVMQSIKEVKREQQSRQIVARLADLRLLLHRAESGQRSYFISGNPVFIGQRNAALAELPSIFERLHNLTADNAGQQQRIRELHHAVNRQIDIFGHSQEIYEAQGFRAAQPVLKNGRKVQAVINKITYETRTAEKNMLHVRKPIAQHADIKPPAAVVWIATSTIFFSHLLFGLRWKQVVVQAMHRLQQALQQAVIGKKIITMWANKQRTAQVCNKLTLPASIGAT